MYVSVCECVGLIARDFLSSSTSISCFERGAVLYKFELGLTWQTYCLSIFKVSNNNHYFPLAFSLLPKRHTESKPGAGCAFMNILISAAFPRRWESATALWPWGRRHPQIKGDRKQALLSPVFQLGGRCGDACILFMLLLVFKDFSNMLYSLSEVTK